MIVGGYSDASGERRGFLYDHGTPRYPRLGHTGPTRADINDRGQVVGYENDADRAAGFMFDGRSDQSISTLLSHSGTRRSCSTPPGSTDDGTILAVAQTGGHHDRALSCSCRPRPFRRWPPSTRRRRTRPSRRSTSPNPGAVTVTEAATNDPPPVGSGYTFLGHQLNITAPAASTPEPISIVFNVDASLLASADPDLTAADIAVFRNGAPVLALHPERPRRSGRRPTRASACARPCPAAPMPATPASPC